jgi:hypothetical protein
MVKEQSLKSGGLFLYITLLVQSYGKGIVSKERETFYMELFLCRVMVKE